MDKWIEIGKGRKEKAPEKRSLDDSATKIVKVAKVGDEECCDEVVRNILAEKDPLWKKGFRCSSKQVAYEFDWCYFKHTMCNSKGNVFSFFVLMCHER